MPRRLVRNTQHSVCAVGIDPVGLLGQYGRKPDDSTRRISVTDAREGGPVPSESMINVTSSAVNGCTK